MKKVNFEVTAQTMIIWKGKPHNKGKVIEGMDEKAALVYQGKNMGKIIGDFEEPKPKTKTTKKKETTKGGDA